MAIRVQNFPTEIFEQNPNYSMSHSAINCPSWWNLHEQLLPQSSSMHFSLKVETPSKLPHKAKQFGLQRKDQDSSSTQSSDLSHHDILSMTGTNSQDQCISSEPAQESDGKHVESQMKPFFFRAHPDFATPSQIDPSMSINCNIPSKIDHTQSINHILYPFADAYSGGLFAAYRPPAVIQQQMVGMTPVKVPLPLDLAEDGPIYVNPKQYHAILRRRQMRAKLEAQNKIAKSRKPYLHESRHQHALNRVRGSGGRFLRTRSDQNPDPNPSTDAHRIPRSSLPSSQHVEDLPKLEPETGKCGAMPIPSCSGMTSVTNSDVVFWQLDRGFSAASHRARHHASVVR